jgi:hypothetical protein|tara:strand:+ start:11656 stop:12030 length:375 start_codon:yes stop_codon:yes gene_type:complete
MKEVTFTVDQVRAMMDEVRADERARCPKGPTCDIMGTPHSLIRTGVGCYTIGLPTAGGQAPSLKGKPVTQSEIDTVVAYIQQAVLGTQLDEHGNRDDDGTRGQFDTAMVACVIVRAYKILEREL